MSREEVTATIESNAHSDGGGVGSGRTTAVSHLDHNQQHNFIDSNSIASTIAGDDHQQHQHGKDISSPNIATVNSPAPSTSSYSLRKQASRGQHSDVDVSPGSHPQVIHNNHPSETISQASTPNQPSSIPSSPPHDNSRGSITSLEGFVQPSSFLRRPRAPSKTMPPPPAPMPKQPESAIDREQRLGLQGIRNFLKARTTYDVMPLSYRLIVLDTSLLVKRSLSILAMNSIVSAPLWDSKTSTFAGLLTTSDYINVIQYYWQNPQELNRMDQFRLSALPEIERAIGVIPIQTISIHPLKPLYLACRTMLNSRARRIPLIDIDDDTKRPWVVNVLTQYRILKFVAMNAKETAALRKTLGEINVGTYEKIQTCKMDTPVIDVIHQLVQYSISSVPILNSDGTVINVFEAVDVIALIKGGVYDDLTLSVGEALQKRSPDFPGIYTCSLDDRLEAIFATLRKSRVHRFVVIDEESKLKGLLSLSDILSYILLDGEGDDY